MSRSEARGFDVRNSTLVSKLLELQRYSTPNDKASWMMTNLACLDISGNEHGHCLSKVFINTDQRSDYIAVSYPWHHTPGLESDACHSYTIVDPRYGSSRSSAVRNVVLDRAIRYARSIRIKMIWIDRECIGQAELTDRQQASKQFAMDAMDLVYSRSDHPLGIMSVILETQWQINTLQLLITGGLLTKDREVYPKLRDLSCRKHVRRALRLLHYLSRDRWWKRAWIFQEEYVSSTRMHLLIRCKSDLKIPSSLSSVLGEVCVNSSDFREGATRFLLAMKRLSSGMTRRRCADLLNVFGKYNVQCIFQQGFQRRAMSCRIFSDIKRRSISQKYDLLPIAANSCGYARRFNTEELQQLGYSVDLCAFAMCLLNGELIRNCNSIRKTPDQMQLGQFLQHSLFNRFRPPQITKKLSFLKGCRLHPVQLGYQGIRTRGHLWRVVKRVNTGAWVEPSQRSYKGNTYTCGLDDLQRDYLFKLVSVLKRDPDCAILVACLETYLNEDLRSHSLVSQSKVHKDTMAGEVVRAIQRKRPLFLVQPLRSHKLMGIFTELSSMQSRVFTSWYDGEGEDGRSRQNRVSIEVEITGLSPPILTSLQWTNGLVFFRNRDAERVVFRWPKAWT